MGNGGFHRLHAFVSALAFIGMMCYAALVPGHVVSQATMAVASITGDNLAPVAEMSCHGDPAAISSAAIPAETPDPGTPVSPKKKCPFCTGIASFHTALTVAAIDSFLDAQTVRALSTPLQEEQITKIARLPQNRGPPAVL